MFPSEVVFKKKGESVGGIRLPRGFWTLKCLVREEEARGQGSVYQEMGNVKEE